MNWLSQFERNFGQKSQCVPDIQFTFLFSSVRCLRNHLKTVHLEEKPFKCKFCNCQTSFASEGRLTTHVIRVHSKTVVRLTRFIYGFNPIWHGRGYFYPRPLSFLDQILSDEFFSKISKLFWSWKLTSIGLFWHRAQLIESNKTCR